MAQTAFHGGFEPETFRARRDRIYQELGDGAMVLPAAPVQRRSGDSEYRYRPDSELLYVTGFEEPDAVVVLRGHADEDRFVVFALERDPKVERWSGDRLGPEAAAELIGADVAYPIAELGERFPELLHGAAAVYYRLGRDSRTEPLVHAALRWSLRKGARAGRGPRTVIDPGEILSEMRIRKEAGELACIRRAVDLTVAGFVGAARRLKPDAGEWELEAILDGGFRAGGGEGPAFASIVGSGANGCVLHYVANESRMRSGDLVLIDAGAEVEYYSGDVTRTFPVSGRFTDAQGAVYEVVHAAHRAAVEAALPGEPVPGIHDAAVRVLSDGLRALGVLEESLDQILEERLYEPFYPHQTSHWLGLDVHDPGDYRKDGEDRSLEPGMVLTIEPGLYFGAVTDDESPFAGIGVRLEDDVLITEEGPERLSAALPVLTAEVEALVAAGQES